MKLCLQHLRSLLCTQTYALSEIILQMTIHELISHFKCSGALLWVRPVRSNTKLSMFIGSSDTRLEIPTKLILIPENPWSEERWNFQWWSEVPSMCRKFRSVQNHLQSSIASEILPCWKQMMYALFPAYQTKTNSLLERC